MKPMDYKKLFFIFLKKRRAYSKFKRNEITVLSSDPYYYISGTFYWTATPEGHNYWKDLSDEWRGVVACIRYSDNLNLGLLKAFNLYKKVESYASLSRIDSFYSVSDFLSVAFGWSESKEGYDYWLKASKEIKAFEV